MAVLKFDGELPDGVFIKRSTNPWLQAADEDDSVDLDLLRGDIGILRNDRTCVEGCSNCIVQGVIESMDTPDGIQRCDVCQLFDGDLEAAQALADAVTEFYNGAVKYSVWFEVEDTADGHG